MWSTWRVQTTRSWMFTQINAIAGRHAQGRTGWPGNQLASFRYSMEATVAALPGEPCAVRSPASVLAQVRAPSSPSEGDTGVEEEHTALFPESRSLDPRKAIPTR